MFYGKFSLYLKEFVANRQQISCCARVLLDFTKKYSQFRKHWIPSSMCPVACHVIFTLKNNDDGENVVSVYSIKIYSFIVIFSYLYWSIFMECYNMCIDGKNVNTMTVSPLICFFLSSFLLFTETSLLCAEESLQNDTPVSASIQLIQKTGTTPENYEDDVFRTFNKISHGFNSTFESLVFYPATTLYTNFTPQTIQHMVGNFFLYINLPRDILLKIFEGDLEGVGNLTMRLAINTTIGGFGLLDPATEMGFSEDRMAIIEVLAKVGLNSGPYLELPLLGPGYLVEQFARVGSILFTPTTYYPHDKAIRSSIFAVGVLNKRRTWGAGLKDVYIQPGDSYARMRTIYGQSSKKKILNALGSEELDYLPEISLTE